MGFEVSLCVVVCTSARECFGMDSETMGCVRGGLECATHGGFV